MGPPTLPTHPAVLPTGFCVATIWGRLGTVVWGIPAPSVDAGRAVTTELHVPCHQADRSRLFHIAGVTKSPGAVRALQVVSLLHDLQALLMPAREISHQHSKPRGSLHSRARWTDWPQKEGRIVVTMCVTQHKRAP